MSVLPVSTFYVCVCVCVCVCVRARTRACVYVYVNARDGVSETVKHVSGSHL